MGAEHLCSKCETRKPAKNFNKEEVKKADEDRVCNACGPPVPKDLNCLTVVQIKEHLVRLGESNLSGKKAELLTRLRVLLDQNEMGEAMAAEVKMVESVITLSENAPDEQDDIDDEATAAEVKKVESATTVSENAPDEKDDIDDEVLTKSSILGFKVADLKSELKQRGLPVSGLKTELQERLAEAGGVSLKEIEECVLKEIENDMEKLTVEEQPAAPSSDGTGSKMDIIEKSEKVEDENDENKMLPFLWKGMAPKDESETKLMHNIFHNWCQKCKSWSASHNTTQHVKKSKKKKNKKAVPLVPSAPGGRPLGIPAHVANK